MENNIILDVMLKRVIKMGRCYNCGNKIERNQFKVYKKAIWCRKCYDALLAERKRKREEERKKREEEKEKNLANDEDAVGNIVYKEGHAVDVSSCTK